MSGDILNIIKQYQHSEDLMVRLNVSNALMALDTPEATSLLLEMATQDADDPVNILAIDMLAQMPPERLAPLHADLGSQFDPSKGKAHIFNWFRSADVIAKATGTSLTSSLGSFWKETRFTRLLNRRMLLSTQSGHGILARLFNRYVWISAVLAFVVTLALFWLLIDNPYGDMFGSLTLAAILSILFGGMPLAVLFTPSTIAFRKSAAGFVDALNILAFAVFCMVVPVFLFLALIGESADPEFYAWMFFYIAVPLVVVRLSLIVSTELTKTYLYVLVLCLVAICALLASYSALLVILNMVQPQWYNFGETMSFNLMITVPIALFLAIHHGIKGNIVPSTKPFWARHTLRSVRWQAMATIGAVWIFVVSASPGEYPHSPGAREPIEVELPAQLAQELTDTSPGHAIRETRLAEMQLRVTELIEDMTQDSIQTNAFDSRLSSNLLRMPLTVLDDPTAADLIEMLGLLYEQADQSPGGQKYLERINDYYDRLLALEQVARESGDENDDRLVDEVQFQRHERVEFEIPVDGSLWIKLSGTRNGFNTDVRMQIGTTWIDHRSGSASELYENDKEEAGMRVIFADLAQPIVREDDLVLHFIDRMGYFYRYYGILGFGRTAVEDDDQSDIRFTAEYGWKPLPVVDLGALDGQN